MGISFEPLAWPDDWKRTASPRSSRYKVTLSQALFALQGVLRQMEAQNVILTSQLPLTGRGQPRSIKARRLSDDDNGVALYFRWQGKDRVFACDCWRGVTDNIRAIGLTLEAMRSIERAGAQELLGRMFVGFTALGAPPIRGAAWNAVLGVGLTASLADIKRAFRNKAKSAHPDVGGSEEMMAVINEAYEQAIAAVQRRDWQ